MPRVAANTNSSDPAGTFRAYRPSAPVRAEIRVVPNTSEAVTTTPRNRLPEVSSTRPINRLVAAVAADVLNDAVARRENRPFALRVQILTAYCALEARWVSRTRAARAATPTETPRDAVVGACDPRA